MSKSLKESTSMPRSESTTAIGDLRPCVLIPESGNVNVVFANVTLEASIFIFWKTWSTENNESLIDKPDWEHPPGRQCSAIFS